MPMFDRTVRHGVVDFIVVFYSPQRRWPAFNIADALLVVGMVLLTMALWRLRPSGAS
jgi:lipoprotein signal peptidase